MHREYRECFPCHRGLPIRHASRYVLHNQWQDVSFVFTAGKMFRFLAFIYIHMLRVLFICTRYSHSYPNGPIARYVKLRVAHAPGMPGTFSAPPRASDPDMHHGTCVTHVPWCMSGSLTSGLTLKSVAGKLFPVFPAHAQPPILRIW